MSCWFLVQNENEIKFGLFNNNNKIIKIILKIKLLEDKKNKNKKLCRAGQSCKVDVYLYLQYSFDPCPTATKTFFEHYTSLDVCYNTQCTSC